MDKKDPESTQEPERITGLKHYPDLTSISRVYPSPRALLGKTIAWQEKRDGSLLCISMLDGKLLISTRNKDVASEHFCKSFLDSEESTAVVQFLKDHSKMCPQVFGEMLIKGYSPVKVELHERNEFAVFDIWNGSEGRFITLTELLQYCTQYGFRCVRTYLLSSHSTLEELYATRDDVLKICKFENREGVVLKAFDGQTEVYAKEKLDSQELNHFSTPKKADELPTLPPLPNSEVSGAIAKVHADIGTDLSDAKKAMPLIAQAVSAECRKHSCSPPQSKSLYKFYQEYLEGIS